MTYDGAFLDGFRSKFAEKRPAPEHYLRRVTKFDLYLTVRDIVDQHRAQGCAWEGIAQLFRELGVPISASTLKTCARRARLKNQRATPTAAPARASRSVRSRVGRTLSRTPASTESPVAPPVESATQGGRKEVPACPEPSDGTMGASEGLLETQRAVASGNGPEHDTGELSRDALATTQRRLLDSRPTTPPIPASSSDSPIADPPRDVQGLLDAARARPPRRQAFHPQRDQEL